MSISVSNFMFHQRFLAIALSAALVLPACKSGDSEQNQSRDTTAQSRNTTTTRTVSIEQKVSEGLDLSQLPELVTEAQNGEELEEILNTSGVNNLDINDDNKIDYLNVEEFREGPNRGFALYTNEDGRRTEVAQVTISQQSQTADVTVQGNPNYYGRDARYQSSFPIGQVLLAGWLFNMTRPRYYHSPYYYGKYPRYYRTSYPVSRTMYRSRARSGFRVKGLKSSRSRNRTRPKTTYKSTTTNGANAASTTGSKSSSTRSLSNTQGKSFSTTTKKRPTGSSARSTSSGFGSSSSRKSTSSFGSSSSRRKPSSSFGGSSSRRKSSFGSSSRRRRRR